MQGGGGVPATADWHSSFKERNVSLLWHLLVGGDGRVSGQAGGEGECRVGRVAFEKFIIKFNLV